MVLSVERVRLDVPRTRIKREAGERLPGAQAGMVSDEMGETGPATVVHEKGRDELGRAAGVLVTTREHEAAEAAPGAHREVLQECLREAKGGLSHRRNVRTNTGTRTPPERSTTCTDSFRL